MANDISTFQAFVELNKIERDTRLIASRLKDDFQDIEDALSARGYNTTEGVFREKEITSIDRTNARNKLVRAYNLKYRGVRPPLPTSRDQTQKVLNELKQDLAGQYDFNNMNLAQKTIGMTTTLGYQLWHDATKHPYITIGALFFGGAAFKAGLTAATSAAFAESVIGQIATDGAIIATMDTGRVNDENYIRSLLQEETHTQLQEFPINFAKGAAGAAVLKGFFAGSTVLGKLLSKEIKNIVNKEQLYANQRKLEKSINSILKDAPTELRAKIFNDIMDKSPSGVHTLGDKVLSKKQLKEYAKAIIENDEAAASNILADVGFEINPESTVGIANIELPRDALATFSEDYIDATAERNIIQTDINLKQILEGLDDAENISGTIGGIRSRDPRQFFTELKTLTWQHVYKRPSGITGRDERRAAAAEAINRSSTIGYQVFHRYRTNFPELLETRKKALNTLFLTEKPIKNDLFETLTNGLSTSDIRQLPRRFQESAITFNKTTQQIQTIESTLRPVFSAKSLEDGFFAGNSLPNKARNGMNAILAQLDEEVEVEINQQISKLINFLKKSNTSSAPPLDSISMESMFDAVRGTGNASMKENAVATILQEGMKKWDLEIISRGNSSLNLQEAGRYIPNLWDPRKVYAVPKEYFVKTMLGLIDTQAMDRIAKSRDRIITDYAKFLGNMYESIRTGHGVRTSRNNMGDLISSGDRIVVMKNGSAWLRAHELFGRTTKTSEVITFITEKYRKALQQSRLGIETTAEAATFNKNLFTVIRKIAGDIEPLKKENSGFQATLRNTELQFQQMLNEVINGNSGTGIGGLHPLLKGTLVLTRKAMLSTAFVTAFFTDFFGGPAILKSVLGVRNENLLSMLRILPGATKKDLKKILAISEYTRNQGLSALTYGRVRRTINTTLNLPVIALDKVADFTESRAKVVFGVTLHDNSSKTFAELEKPLSDFLRSNGIIDRDWEIYRALPSLQIGGAYAKLSGHLDNLSIADKVLLRKFAVAEQAAAMLAAPAPSPLGRTFGIKPGASNYSKALAYVTDPFVNTAYSVYMTQWNNLIQILYDKGVEPLGLISAQLLFSGYLTYYSKALLRGENPDVTSKNTLLQALLYGGFAGPAADRLVESMLGFSHSQSPLESSMEILKTLAKGETKGLYKTLRYGTLSINPYRNIALAGQIAQKYTTDKLFAIIDPEGYEKFSKRIKERNEKGELKDWAVKALLQEDTPYQ